ncbi:MAG: hypothetical protein WCX31_19930 [Salinivirgaceae bacterium]|jgi:hypothetical protein
MKKYLFACFVALVSFFYNAQGQKLEEIKLTGIVGEALGGEQFSPEQVKQKAINAAKIKALQKAGIEENIKSYTDYFRSESDNKMEELFTSDVLSNIEGTVKEIEVVDAKPGFTMENQIKYTVTINCTVVKYNVSKDLTFDAWIEGIKPFYKEGTLLTFTVKPTQVCFLRAFVFTEESYILFPNEHEKSFLLPAMEISSFPEKVEYELTIDKKQKETNRLIIVLLKKDIYYTGKLEYKEITDWIMSIPPDERMLESFAFEVFKK